MTAGSSCCSLAKRRAASKPVSAAQPARMLDVAAVDDELLTVSAALRVRLLAVVPKCGSTTFKGIASARFEGFHRAGRPCQDRPPVLLSQSLAVRRLRSEILRVSPNLFAYARRAWITA